MLSKGSKGSKSTVSLSYVNSSAGSKAQPVRSQAKNYVCLKA